MTGIDESSEHTFTSFCTQAMIGTFLWGMWRTVNLPEFWAIAKGLAV